MREILFRGKQIDNSKWVYGDFQLCSLQCFIVERGTFKKYKVIPETIGQYTGLTDKNGRKIFEGDIHERENHFFIVKYGKYTDCETNEDGYGWYFEYAHKKACEGFYGDEDRYVNIVDNIHDNPELLVGEQRKEDEKND